MNSYLWFIIQSIGSQQLHRQSLFYNFLVNDLLEFFLRCVLQKVQHLELFHLLTQLLIHLRVELLLFIIALTHSLIRLNLFFQRVILLLYDLELILCVLDHFLENLNLFVQLLLGHLIETVIGLELLLVVDRNRSTGPEFVLRYGGTGW